MAGGIARDVLKCVQSGESYQLTPCLGGADYSVADQTEKLRISKVFPPELHSTPRADAEDPSVPRKPSVFERGGATLFATRCAAEGQDKKAPALGIHKRELGGPANDQTVCFTRNAIQAPPAKPDFVRRRFKQFGGLCG